MSDFNDTQPHRAIDTKWYDWITMRLPAWMRPLVVLAVVVGEPVLAVVFILWIVFITVGAYLIMYGNDGSFIQIAAIFSAAGTGISLVMFLVYAVITESINAYRSANNKVINRKNKKDG